MPRAPSRSNDMLWWEAIQGHKTKPTHGRESMPNPFRGVGQPIANAGFQSALDTIGVTAAELWAVIGVETSGSGFLADRRPTILFERHVFSQRTGGRFDGSPV